ncbi:MAG: hypothetical protein K6G80_10095 [Treponema sp.]|nr:hypothetical protein [Treponema sp.]
MRLQFDWLSTGSEKSRAELWTFAAEVARRIVKREVKNIGYRNSADWYTEKAYDAVMYIMKRYGGSYVIKSNYISALKQAVIHALFYRTKAERCAKLATALMLQGVDERTAYQMAKKEMEGGKSDEGSREGQHAVQLCFDFGQG